MKRLMALALVLALALGMGLVASADEAVTTDSGAKVIHYGKQIELKIPVYERAGAADPINDNYWTRWIQENFGDVYNIKVTFVPIPRNDEVSKFTMLMAGGKETAPDLVFHYDNPQILVYISEGYFMELDDAMVREYMPDYLAYVGEEVYDAGKYSVDGEMKQLILPAARDQTFNWANVIRQDWLDALGLEMPRTLDAYIDVLRAFRDNNMGGENTIAATQMLCSTTNLRADTFREGHTDARELAMYSDLNVAAIGWAPVEENLRYLNTLYNEGLISSEFALDTDGTQMKADFVNGVSGVYGFNLSSNSDVISTLMDNCLEAKLSILNPWSGTPEGYTLYDYLPEPVGIRSGISVYCEHPEAVMMYLNWMAQPEILDMLEYGYEGKNYFVDPETNLRVLDSAFDGEERFASTNSNGDLYVVIAQNRRDATSVEAMAAAYCPTGYDYLMYEIYDYEAQKTYLTNYRFSSPIESQSEYQATLKEMFQSMSTELIMCAPEDFDALYARLAQEYLDAGYQEILDEKSEVYDLENP